MSDSQRAAAHLRPHFFIIGERKCGTSSLYRYLLDHPQVLPGPRKEMQFFTRGRPEVERGFQDYLCSFPRSSGSEKEVLDWPELDAKGVLYQSALRFDRSEGAAYVTGEASADTMCDVDPTLLRDFLPALKLIAILRDPVERAFSHHRMFQRFQEEGRALDFQVRDFETDMRLELAMQESGHDTPCLSPGLYAQHLRSWNLVWGDARPLVLFSEDLQDEARALVLMARVLTHLQLPSFDYRASVATRYNQAPSASIPESIVADLRAFYKTHNEALEAVLGTPVPWPC